MNKRGRDEKKRSWGIKLVGMNKRGRDEQKVVMNKRGRDEKKRLVRMANEVGMNIRGHEK